MPIRIRIRQRRRQWETHSVRRKNRTANTIWQSQLTNTQDREGGGWRKNVFAPGIDRWTYFRKQCRERFENAFTERWMRTSKKVKRIETRQKQLAVRRRKLRCASPDSESGRVDPTMEGNDMPQENPQRKSATS